MQKSEDVNAAQFKLLFYKEDRIIDTEEGYFMIYAENLNGIDSTDVASVWVYGIDYDRFEYIYEQRISNS